MSVLCISAPERNMASDAKLVLKYISENFVHTKKTAKSLSNTALSL